MQARPAFPATVPAAEVAPAEELSLHEQVSDGSRGALVAGAAFSNFEIFMLKAAQFSLAKTYYLRIYF